jgi:methyl-accepting chemotaxis protein
MFSKTTCFIGATVLFLVLFYSCPGSAEQFSFGTIHSTGTGQLDHSNAGLGFESEKVTLVPESILLSLYDRRALATETHDASLKREGREETVLGWIVIGACIVAISLALVVRTGVLNSYSLAARFYTCVGLLLILTVVVGGGGYYFLDSVYSYSHLQVEAMDLHGTVGEVEGLAFKYVLYGLTDRTTGQHIIEDAKEKASGAAAVIRKVEGYSLESDETPVVDEIASDFEMFLPSFDKLVKSFDNVGAHKENLNQYSENLLDDFDALIADFQSLLLKMEKNEKASVANLLEVVHFLDLLREAQIAVLKLDVLHFEFLVTRQVEEITRCEREISRVHGLFKKLAYDLRNLPVSAEVIARETQNFNHLARDLSNYEDELGKLIVAQLETDAELAEISEFMDRGMVNSKALVDRTGWRSSQTVGKAVTTSGALVILSILVGVFLAIIIVRSVTTPVGMVIDNLTNNAVQVSTASGQVAASSQQLAEGSSEQASSLEEVSSSLEEMTSMTQQNAENARQANDMAETARHAANEGSVAMERMASAIDTIKASSDETAKIVKTIDEIAFQTNLLALNAAVEAARAGDAGKGFAVVAVEVRNLAQRSAEAARDTAELIDGAQKNAESGVAVSEEVSTILKQIAESVESVSQVVAEVAAASKEQAQGIEQVTTAVSQMDQVTQSTASNAEESASAAEELSSMSVELNSLVDVLVGIVTGSAVEGGTVTGRRAVTGRTAVTGRRAVTGRTAVTGRRAVKQDGSRRPARGLSDTSQPGTFQSRFSSGESAFGRTPGAGTHPSLPQTKPLRPEDVIPMDDDEDFQDF